MIDDDFDHIKFVRIPSILRKIPFSLKRIKMQHLCCYRVCLVMVPHLLGGNRHLRLKADRSEPRIVVFSIFSQLVN